jgi:4-hydroxybenzoate polyprenyltransferase
LTYRAPPTTKLRAHVSNARISILLIPVVFGYYFIQASLGRIVLLTPDPARTALAILSMMAVGAAGAYWNSIVDVEVDRVNHPDWPIPSGVLSLREVKIASVFLAAAAEILGSLVTTNFLVLETVTLVLAAAYSLPPFRFKTRFWLRYACHSLIIMVFLPLSFWVIYAGIDGQIIATVFLLFIFRFLAWGAKDIKDMPGDAKRNIPTIPTRYGKKRALQLFEFAVALCWGLLIIFFYEGIITNPLLVAVGFGLPAITVVGRTVRTRKARFARREAPRIQSRGARLDNYLRYSPRRKSLANCEFGTGAPVQPERSYVSPGIKQRRPTLRSDVGLSYSGSVQ